MTRRLARVSLFILTFPILAQDPEPSPAASWEFRSRLELRANYRNSREQRVQLRFPFPPDFLPVGQTVGFEETVDAGSHVELSVLQLRLDARHSKTFHAHAQVHAIDKYRRNPTSDDRKIDVDELFIRFGHLPEFVERPPGTSFFMLVGKAPKMEKQPVRLLESYGLAANAFNRFEDIQALAGGSIGRNLYWRLQLANGNPLYFRDTNALAGDNGIRELLTKNPDPELKSGFPILYNAESEGYFFDRKHLQFGQALGYRWQNAAETIGFDAIAFHYKRKIGTSDELEGTFYGSEIDLLDGVAGFSLPISGDRKEETGGRVYAELWGATAIAQFTKQHVAGLNREAWEVEAGYQFPLNFGPVIGGESLVQFIQPAVRFSRLKNRFRGPAQYPAPSVWWPWSKLDAGVRIGFAKGVDLTIEHAHHSITKALPKLNPSETLVTLRVRI